MNIKNLRIKKVAFPHEHGSWGFFLEPIILTLVIAYSNHGLIIACSAFLLFLAHQPLTIILKNAPKNAIASAYLFLSIYSIIAIGLVGFLYFNSSDLTFFVPCILAIFIMLFYIGMEVRNKNRNLIIEFLAPIAVTLIAISIPIKDNWDYTSLFALFIIMLSRSVQTVFYINVKLKFFKGNTPNVTLVNFVGFLFLLIISGFAVLGYSPFLSIVAVLLLMIRAYIGLLPKNKNERVKIVGIKEFIYGFLFVIINALGYLVSY